MVKFMRIYCEPQNSILIVISFDIILILFRQLKSLKFVHEAYQLTLIILRSQPFAFFMFHDFDCCLIQESSSMPFNKTKNASLLTIVKLSFMKFVMMLHHSRMSLATNENKVRCKANENKNDG
jgi:hypothetical protein